MYEFLKDNHNPEMLELLDRVYTLNMETTLGCGREDYTSEETDESFDGKWKLLMGQNVVLIPVWVELMEY